MSDSSSRDHAGEITVLVTGLFNDAVTVESALEQIAARQEISKITLEPENMNPDDWDEVVRLILSAPKVITV